jgi:hypothetical protein
MGKVIKMLEKIRQMNDADLFKRFEEVSSDNILRGPNKVKPTKEDTVVKVETGLIKEEIMKRMLNGPLIKITEEDDKREHREEVKEKVIGDLLNIISGEVDYWLLEENKSIREMEYGLEFCNKMGEHYVSIRNGILNIMFILTGLK